MSVRRICKCFIFAAIKSQFMESKKEIKYRWREAFNNVWHETRCEVLSKTDKTAKIKLLEFGKNGARPNTVMRVHLKSLIGLEQPKVEADTSWQRYTYFD